MRIAAGLALLMAVLAIAESASSSSRAVQDFGIYEVGIEGSGRTTLLHDPTVYEVDISRDRTRILLHRLMSNDLYSAAIDGSDLRLVVSAQSVHGYLGAATWSPAGRRVAVEVLTETSAEIWVAKSDGTSLRRLVGHAIRPAWSPDGRRIAYIGSFQGHDPAGAITVGMSTRPLRPRQLGPIEFGNPDNTDYWTLRWSPRGDLVGYTTFRDGHERVAIVRANGPIRRSVTVPRAGRFAAWSPSGKRMLYWEGASHRIIAARPDGRGRRFVTASYGQVGWSPDGRWIASVDKVRNGCYQIFVLRPNGEGRRRLTDEPCNNSIQVFWSLDSRRIIYKLTVFEP